MEDYFKRLLFIMDNGKININNKKKGNKDMKKEIFQNHSDTIILYLL